MSLKLPPILVVDDERNMCRSLHDLLEAEGYTTRLVESAGGHEAQLFAEGFSAPSVDVRTPAEGGTLFLLAQSMEEQAVFKKRSVLAYSLLGWGLLFKMSYVPLVLLPITIWIWKNFPENRSYQLLRFLGLLFWPLLAYQFILDPVPGKLYPENYIRFFAFWLISIGVPLLFHFLEKYLAKFARPISIYFTGLWPHISNHFT